MTPGLPFGSHPCNPFALVASPKLGLQHQTSSKNPHVDNESNDSEKSVGEE